MRTLQRILLATALLVAVTATGWAQNASKKLIVGSQHDLTTFTYTSSGGTAETIATNLCYFCHIMHKTSTGTLTGISPGYLLWNHTMSTVGSYGVYSSDTFNQRLSTAGGTIADLGSTNSVNTPTVSNLCLSCHDGTIALASFYQVTAGLPSNGSTLTNKYGTFTDMPSVFQLSDLSRSHPVNFPYTAALATASGGTLLSPGTNSVDGTGYLPLYGLAGANLMECTTCHDPHNGTALTVTNGTTTSTIFPFPRLLLYNYSGAGNFCDYCHL